MVGSEEDVASNLIIKAWNALAFRAGRRLAFRKPLGKRI